ncbi:MAG: hypothetical protein V1720_19650 [bacterium]
MKKSLFKMVLFLAVIFLTYANPVSPQEFSPTMIYHSMLNGIVYNAGNGVFRFVEGDDDNAIKVVFLLPELVKEKNPVTMIFKKESTVIQEYHWRIGQLKGAFYWLVKHDVNKAPFVKEVGNYSLEFYVKDKLIFNFPFSISIVKSSDPYNPGEGYFLEGAWNDVAYLYIKENNPESPVLFKTWFRTKSLESSKRKVQIELIKDGKVIAKYDKKDGDIVFMPSQWLEKEFGFDQGRFKGKDLMKDGKYNFKVTVDEQLYGNYKFTVNGGKVQYIDKQDRMKTTTIDCLEGGPDVYYLIKEN